MMIPTEYSFNIVTLLNYYQCLATLIQSEFSNTRLKLVQSFDIIENLNENDSFVWLLDLDYLGPEQRQQFLRLKPEYVLAIGLVKRPENYNKFIQDQRLANILYIPHDYGDLEVNTWVGAGFLAALYHTIQSQKKIIPFPGFSLKSKDKELERKYLNFRKKFVL